jgi:hypothetical protein
VAVLGTVNAGIAKVKVAKAAWEKLALTLKAVKLGLTMAVKGNKAAFLLQGTALKAYKATMVAVKAGKALWAGAVKTLTIAKTALGVAKTVLLGPIGLVVAGIAGLVVGIKALIRNWDSVRDTATQVWAAITDTMGRAWAFIRDRVLTPLGDGIQNVVDWFAALPARVVTALGNVGGLLVDVGRNLIQGLLNGIGNAAGLVRDAVMAPVRNAIDSVRSFLRINSPSGLARDDLGKPFMEGLALGFSQNARTVIAAADVVAHGLVERIRAVADPGLMNDLGRYVTESFASGLVGGRAQVRAAFESFGSTLSRAYNDVLGQVRAAESALSAAQNSYRQLLAGGNLSADRIRSARQAIIEASQQLTAARYLEGALARTTEASTRVLEAQGAALDDLARKYDKYAARLVTANGHLDNLRETKERVEAVFTRNLGADGGMWDYLAGAVGRFASAVMGSRSQIESGFEAMIASLDNAAYHLYTHSGELSDSQREHYRLLRDSIELLNDTLESQRARLYALTTAYQGYSRELQDAKRHLEQVINAQVRAGETFAAAFSRLPGIGAGVEDGETNLSAYLRGLRAQYDDTRAMAAVVQQLMGYELNKETFRQIMAKGVGALDFAQELAAGGVYAVKEINTLQKNLCDASVELGREVAAYLSRECLAAAQKSVDAFYDKRDKTRDELEKYTGVLNAEAQNIGRYVARGLLAAGQDCIEGLIGGIESRLVGVREQMEAIAANITVTITKELEITPHGSSKVLDKAGKAAAQGMIDGIEAQSGKMGEIARAFGAEVATRATGGLQSTAAEFTDATQKVVDDAQEIISSELGKFYQLGSDVGKYIGNGYYKTMGGFGDHLYSEVATRADRIMRDQFDPLQHLAETVGVRLAAGLYKTMGGFGDHLYSEIVTTGQQTIRDAFEGYENLGEGVPTNIVKGFDYRAKDFTDALNSLLDDSVEKLADALPDFDTAGKNLCNEITAGFNKRVQYFVTECESAAGSAEAALIAQTASFTTIGSGFGNALAAGIRSTIPDIQAAAAAAASAAAAANVAPPLGAATPLPTQRFSATELMGDYGHAWVRGDSGVLDAVGNRIIAAIHQDITHLEAAFHRDAQLAQAGILTDYVRQHETSYGWGGI